MHKILVAACALIAAPALAQTPPAPPPPVPAPGPHEGKVQLRSEVIARTQRMFAMLDTNHDGVLDQNELAAAAQRSAGAPGDAAAPARMPMDRNAMFDMIDTNHDGMISRDEFARAPMPHAGMAAGEGMRERGGGGAGMARMWTKAAAAYGGRITLQQATDLALRRFDQLDTNHDGQLTPEERAAGRGMRDQ